MINSVQSTDVNFGSRYCYIPKCKARCCSSAPLPTSLVTFSKLREKQIRRVFFTIPAPNNNPYCIDDHSVWLNWNNLDDRQKKLFTQICRLNALRRKHPVFTDLTLYNGKEMSENGKKDITWLRPDGQEMTVAEWTLPYHKTGAYMINGAATSSRQADDDFLIMASGDNYHTVDYTLPTPPSGGKWQLLLDTSEGKFADTARLLEPNSHYALKPYSFVVLTRKKSMTRVNQKVLAAFVEARKKRR